MCTDVSTLLLKCSCSGQEFLCLNYHRAGLFNCYFQTLPSIADFLPPLFLPPQSLVLSHLLRCEGTVCVSFVLLIWHNGLNIGIMMFSSLFRLTSSYSYTSSRSSCPNWGRTKWDILTTSSGGCPAFIRVSSPKSGMSGIIYSHLFQTFCFRGTAWNLS